MITFPDALELLLQAATVLPTEVCRIENAAGRVLREAVRADREFPPFDRVMMDGFALRAADLRIGRKFKVVGSAPAGQAVVGLARVPFACLEVMTGAPLPIGADRIVPVEEIVRTAVAEITVSEGYESLAGRHIHRAGSDAAAAMVLLEPGLRLGSREIGVAAACGAGWLRVSKLPQIAVIATGDELVAVDATPASHQIRQSNAHALDCALQRAGYPPVHTGTLGDEAGEAEAVLGRWLESCGWLILTGAVSKGARDFVPETLAALGCEKIFHGVAQRPGKPAGCWRGPTGQIVLALPGNPVSALTNLHVFGLPALEMASGLAKRARRLVAAPENAALLTGFTHHLPVVLAPDGRAHAAATGNSGDFIGLLKSDGFLTLPPRGDAAAAHPFTPWL
jgi:molybdopterin molybdotransferase